MASGPGRAPRFESAPPIPEAADDAWDPRFSLSGVNSYVLALAWDGANLYVGGNFTSAGGVPANYIAKWDGRTWSALGSGMDDKVTALVWGGGKLFAAGYFTSAGGIEATGIAQWNGSSWSPLGSGVEGGYVTALVWGGGKLFAAGYFTSAGGAPVNYVAMWNGAAWSSLGTGVDDVVSALVWAGGALYAGGYFATAGGVEAKSVAKWDGSYWSAVGSGVDSGVYALACDGANLYAAGDFWNAGGAPAQNVAKWDGLTWSALGSGIVGYSVTALASDGANLYAGGWFHTAGGVAVNNVAKWDGSSWSALGTGIEEGESSSRVWALVWGGASLFAGGVFNFAGGGAAHNLSRWSGSSWERIPADGQGVCGYGPVTAVAWDGKDLFAGGAFSYAGNVAADAIAKWDGTAWSALGGGLTGSSPPGVSALARAGSDLYVAGGFDHAGGVPAFDIARWDGATWSALGPGEPGHASSLAWDGSNLYTGSDSGKIARWDGTAWCMLGTGANYEVYSLAWGGTNLFAGGAFTTVDGVAARHVAKWDGTSWSPLGAGVSGDVYALAWDGANLYAGSSYHYDRTEGPSLVHRWDGTNWSAVGTDFGGGSYGIVTVYALLWDGADLYAGGDFTSAGGVSANRVARWDGISWSALGSGVNDYVRALALDDTHSPASLYVGGGFTMAGGKPSYQIARWCLGDIDCAAAAEPTSGAAPLQVTFTATASVSGVAEDASYLWDFGDGASSSLQNPVHIYTLRGIYTWTMTATAGGFPCVRTGTVTVTSTCALSCTASASPDSGPAPLKVSFSAAAEPAGCAGPVAYFWELGGQSASSTGQGFSLLFPDPGVYEWAMTASFEEEACTRFGTVTVTGGCGLACSATVAPDSGDAPLKATFSASVDPGGCSGSPSYVWIFGDGQSSRAANTTHTYATPGTYTWGLVVEENGTGCSKAGTITVNRKCTLGCEPWVPTEARVGESVEMDSGTYALFCLDEPSINWSFGDGGSSTERYPSHTYASAGEFTWTLSVTVEDRTCTQTGTIAVMDPCAVTCTAGASPSIGAAPLAVGFSATATPSVCSGAVSFDWSFGDGATSTEQSPSHTYAEPGTYGWTLTAAVEGKTCSQTGTVTVVPPCVLACEASATPDHGTAPLAVSFTAAVYATDCIGDPVFLWLFGDGATSSEPNPTHTYAAPGDYAWSLTVIAGGRTCSASGSVTVNPALPGDGNNDGIVSIGEVQQAINMFLGLAPAGNGADCNGDGAVSIGEVQKVINAFLGLPSIC